MNDKMAELYNKIEKISAKAIRGLMERTYKTSNLDKIRIKMQDDE